MSLACNIMNAIGGTPAINPRATRGPLPGDVGGGFGDPPVARCRRQRRSRAWASRSRPS